MPPGRLRIEQYFPDDEDGPCLECGWNFVDRYAFELVDADLVTVAALFCQRECAGAWAKKNGHEVA